MTKRKPNYNEKIASLYRAMTNEMWNIIEQRAKTDQRYQAPARFSERAFESNHEICEVDYGGHSYGVKGVLIKECHKGYKSVTIIAHDDYYYDGLDLESVCVVLSALRRQRYRKAA